MLKKSDRVVHIKDNSLFGTVVEVDNNLRDITTCKVIWDDDKEQEPDIQWTNKLIKI